ncbi:MAG: UDP-2,3-diacylglucosamine diphosphatase LpxI [Chlamydiae bacterium]|nr:UDP-2,3-diacylglucosamine diphosphatase LpxI [Chlamydiota bacterium]MBI3266175.1 UDP-2,3-diacylglucosamine diphosphatase LpxI [Chlamydiota bacterium]
MHNIDSLGIIAGNRDFPLSVAESARQQGVKKIIGIGFLGITDRSFGKFVDQMFWIGIGEIGKLLKILKESQVHDWVMAGQIPHKFALRALKFDVEGLKFFKGSPQKDAKSLLGGLIQKWEKEGVHFLESTLFLKSELAEEGVLTNHAPSDEDWQDLKYGLRVAKVLADLEVGQTVVVKKGVLVALEGMEGTDATILRGGKLAGKGAVVVKMARSHQDMRYDVPVIGLKTLRVLRKAKASLLGVEAGKTLILDRKFFFEKANRWGLSMVGLGRENAKT